MPFYPQLIGPRRRLLQLALATLVAGMPFVSIHGNAFLRLDIPGLTLELVGHRFRIEELYLAWLFVLGLIFVFILMAMTLGRVWCGWACPQTALSDLAEVLIKKKALRPFRHLGYLLISLWGGATFVWYFISPFDFMGRLVNGQLWVWPAGTTITVATLLMVDLTFVRRLFCRAFCPYGRFQTVLADKGTLTLQAHPDHIQRCIDCKACLRGYATAIDIRRGYQIECISCARCLDACRTVMARRGEEGITRYTFGQDDLGWRAILTAKTVGVALMVAVIGATTIFLASHRASATFRIGRSVMVASRLTEGGRQFTFFSGSIVNRREKPQQITLSVSSSTGEAVTIKGTTQFTLAGNEKRDINLAVDSPVVSGNRPVPITFSLLSGEDGSRIDIAAYLTAAEQGGKTAPK